MPVEAEKFEGRGIASIEYEIPDTGEELMFYYKGLWLPELYANLFDREKRKIQGELKTLASDARSERLKTLHESVLKMITSPQAMHDGITHIITAIRENRRKCPSKVDVIDLAAGSATAMDELKERMADLRAVRLDLVVDRLRGQKIHAVAGDALQLPFENEIAPLVLSRGLVMYLLEEPERTHIIPYITTFLKTRNPIERQRCFDYLQSRERCFDFALLEKHFSEIRRVLAPNGIARVEPFYMEYMLHGDGPQHNSSRLQKFMELLDAHFSFYQFYQNPLAPIPFHSQSKVFDKLADGISDENIAKNFKRIFDVKNLKTSLGMLKLRK